MLQSEIFKIDKFGDIDYGSKTLFRDVIFTLNYCEPIRPKDASGRHKVSASRSAQASKRDCS